MDFKVYSRRWGHEDVYLIERTSGGWKVEFASMRGECAKDGSPHLFEILDHDFISYPSDLGSYLERLWTKAKEDYLSDAEIQSYLERCGP